MLKKIYEAYEFIQNEIGDVTPEIGIVLGTGLGALVSEIKIEKEISYEKIPYFPVSTVESHAGKLIFGTLANKKILVMQGRFHYYEGYSMQEITFPIRIMHLLKIHTLLISNACGGMNPLYQKGDIMAIHDHINLLGDNPLIGKNLDEFGPRFPDMSEPYDKNLLKLVDRIAIENKFKIQHGVYVAVSGPSLETKAEYRFLRGIGADVVGMSTIPEVIVARHQGMKVLALSVITDECFPDSLTEVSVEEIIDTAKKTEPKLTLLMKSVIENI
jgi:purine-nucleoside phosphorylase